MNNLQEQFKMEAARIALTSHEKSAIRAALRGAMSGRPTPSPYQHFFHVPQMILAGLLIVFLTGGGTAYAAQGALPGDVLYAVKVNVAEPLEGVMQFSSQAKANWHAAVAERRIIEAETLVSEGKLTNENAAELANNFDTHASAVAALAEVVATEDPAADGELPAKVATTLNAHSAVLTLLGSTASSSSVGDAAITLAMTVSMRARAFSQAQDQTIPDATTISQTATSSTAGEVQVALAPRSKKQTSLQNTEGVTISMETGGSQKESASSSVATTSASQGVAASLSTISQPQLDRLRASATGAVNDLKKRVDGKQDLLDDSTKLRVQSVLHEAQSLIEQGASTKDFRLASQSYMQALQLALSMTTYLGANAAFPSAHLLPALIEVKGGDESESH